MKQFIQTDFFRFIKSASAPDVSSSVLDNAYEKFSEIIFAKTAGTSDRVLPVLHKH